MTDAVLELRKVLIKKNVTLQLENKCENLVGQIMKFHKNLSALQQKGLPSLRYPYQGLVQQ